MKSNNMYLPSIEFYQKLIPNKDKEFFYCYLRWIYLLSIRAFNVKKTHPNSFNLLYKSVSKKWSRNTLLGKLQHEFIVQNISLSILLEPIDGFHWFYKKLYEIDFTKAAPMLLQLLAPISRFVAILNNQKPPFYQPFSNLIFVYMSLYIIENQDLIKLLKKSSIKINKQKLLSQLPLHFNEANQIISITKGTKFKLIVAFYLGLYKVLTKKNEKKISFLDYVNSILYGLYYIIISKDNTKGLNKI